MNLNDTEEQVLRNRLRGNLQVTPEDTLNELLQIAHTLNEAERKNTEKKHAAITKEEKIKIDAEFKAQKEEILRRKKELEDIHAAQGLNSVNVQPTGREIDRDVLIMPRRITQAYNENEGKFYAKNSSRLMFQDKGEKLVTSTTDKEAIADMVAYAKAKQWESLKLTGSPDFRREAWLQAESQGIKTQGYTPKQADLAALQSLTQERSTNMISPVKERQKERNEQTVETEAPRHDINKNQATMHDEATKNLTTNMQALQKIPALANKSIDDLTKLAYWRGVLMENNKLQSPQVQDEALSRFDKQAQDPQFLQRLNQETEGTIKDKTIDRVQNLDTPERTL